jgi:type I restriction enzyme, S subunit
MNLPSLPKHWKVARISELAVNRQHALTIGPFGSDLKTSDYRDYGVPIVFVRDVQPNSFHPKTRQYVSEPKARELAPHVVRPGDLVVTKMGLPPCVAAVYPDSEPPGIVTADIIKFSVDDTKLDRKYAAYFLNTEFAKSQIAGITFGITRPKVTLRDFKELRLPFPPLSEQRRIVEVLDRAEALRAKRRAAFTKLGGLTQAVFLEMFGDHRTILNRWPTQRLGDVLAFLTSGSRGWATHYSESGDLFLRIQNVRRNELVLDDVTFVRPPNTAEAKRTRVEAGDVLLSITADLGRVAVVPPSLGQAFINQHLAILRTKALVPQFLSAYLASPAGQLQVLGRNRQGVKAGLNFDDIRSIVVPKVPKELQQTFACRADKVERLKAAQCASLAEMDALFASLQYRAFRGEL